MKLLVLLLGVLCIHYAQGQATSAKCTPVKGSTTEFKVVFSYDKSTGPAVTGLESFFPSENPTFTNKASGADCATTTASSISTNIYTIEYVFDTTLALPCGLEKSGTDYDGIVSPIGTDVYYSFTCDTTNPDLPVEVETEVETGHLDTVTESTFAGFTAILEVVNPLGTALPEVQIGTPIKLKLTYKPGYTNGAVSTLRVNNLIEDDVDTFDNYAVKVIDQTCNDNNANSIFKTIGLFSTVVTAGPVVLETNVFRAHRFATNPLITNDDVHFRVEFEPCFGDLDGCNTCIARRKRADDQQGVQHLDVKLRVTDKPTDGQGHVSGRSECGALVVYWTPHVLLLLIIALESVFTAYMLRQKTKLC